MEFAINCPGGLMTPIGEVARRGDFAFGSSKERSMNKWVLLVSGGFCGTIGRYTLAGAVHRWLGSGFPYGTFVVNALGCLCIGFLSSLAERKFLLSPEFRMFWMIGLLGAFTTFSTLIYESGQLLQNGQMGAALLNLIGSLAVGLLAWWAGTWVAALL